LNKTGVHLIRITCEHFPDEVTELNNERELAAEVVKAKDEIAVYFPLLNNSFRPLLREFLKEKEGVFTAVYKVADNSYRLRGHKMNPAFTEGLPKHADQLKDVTCLILGSHNGELLSPAEALVLEQYVNKGGTLVCLAGTESYGKLPAGSPLVRLLPVVTLEDSYCAGTFKVLPDQGADNAMVEQIREIIADNSGAVDFTLSGINQVKGVKASAKVLLWAVEDARQPLMVWQPYGRGKVVALLSNTFHQWGAPEQREENFGRFWRQLIAFSKNPDDDADLLQVALPKTELAVNESVAVTAIARHPSSESGVATNAQLSVKADLFFVDGETPVASLALEKKSDCFMADLPGLQPGRYVLRVTSQDGQEVLRTRYKFLLVGDILAENALIRSDRETFRNFSSEKHIFTPDEVERLEESLLEAVRKNIVRRERFLIFETPFFFISVVMLLLTEWFLRRRFNLF
ncbi:MAG: glutamine amidotransferase, partial [Kiritimatiellae bacterium]|nr:glutamine amidotransferase [Kiritimatiellia bacterium]